MLAAWVLGGRGKGRGQGRGGGGLLADQRSPSSGFRECLSVAGLALVVWTDSPSARVKCDLVTLTLSEDSAWGWMTWMISP